VAGFRHADAAGRGHRIVRPQPRGRFDTRRLQGPNRYPDAAGRGRDFGPRSPDPDHHAGRWGAAHASAEKRRHHGRDPADGSPVDRSNPGPHRHPIPHADAHAVPDSRSHADAHAVPDAYPAAHSNSYGPADAEPVPDPPAASHAYAHAAADAHADAASHAYAHAAADAHADAAADAHADTCSDAHADTCSDAHADTGSDRYAHGAADVSRFSPA
jgi:hypothetical protein